MLWYKKSQNQTKTIRVFHGSDESGLTGIDANMPSYGGGLGAGVYVGTEIETAKFYGEHVYELKTKFGWEQVFSITGEDNYFPIEGGAGGEEESLSSGESIPPFQFDLNGKLYAVTSLEGGYGDETYFTNSFNNNLNEAIRESGFRQDVKDAILSHIDWAASHMRYEHDAEDYREYIENTIPEEEVDDSHLASIVSPILVQLQNIINEVEVNIKQSMPTEIALDEIGEYVKEAGYRALFVSGIRGGSSVNEEMLVFNPEDLIMVKQIS